MRYIFILFVIVFSSCEKEDTVMDVWQKFIAEGGENVKGGSGIYNHYAFYVQKQKMDSAEVLNMIQAALNEYPIYDSLYVTRVPAESRSVYSVVPINGETVIYIFHFYSVKTRRSPNTTNVNYDNYADSVGYYLEWR